MPLISGGTTGTPVSSGVGIPPDTIPAPWPNCAVPLARYADIIGYDQCAFWGVRYDGQESLECGTFWTEWERQSLADALAQAQQMIEDVLGYPLCPTFITGQLATDWRYVDEQPATGNPIVTRWAYILQPGVRAETVIVDNAGVDYTAEPAVVGPIATTVTDQNEVAIFHAGSDRTITPSRIIIAGGLLTIYIPRCRLVNPDLLDTITGSVGLDYTDLDNFVDAVDVKRVYVDPSVNANLVREHSCTALCSAEGCASQTDAACIVVRDAVQGVVLVRPGIYNDGWSHKPTGHCYNHVRLNYLAGLRTVTRQIEMVVVRLAHSLMPAEPCGCETAQRFWERDRYVGEILSREMLNNPWGYSAGALFAYAWATQNALSRGGVA